MNHFAMLIYLPLTFLCPGEQVNIPAKLEPGCRGLGVQVRSAEWPRENLGLTKVNSKFCLSFLLMPSLHALEFDQRKHHILGTPHRVFVVVWDWWNSNQTRE